MVVTYLKPGGQAPGLPLQQAKGLEERPALQALLLPSKSRSGKVATRPGQLSKKELARKAEEARLQALEQQEDDTEQQTSRRSSSMGSGPPDVIQEVPQVVNDRMLRRITIFTGSPVFLGLLLFPLFYYLKVVRQVDLPTQAVYAVQSVTFGGGLLGITYAILSTSWDPSSEGSLLGFNEFKANLALLLANRNRDRS